MQLLKQSTAVTISIGPCLDSAGAEYTGLVIGDLTLTKNGTSAAMAAAASLTHVSNGHYDLVTIVGNSDTLGRLIIRCNKLTYQIPPREFMVLPATVYDALITNAAGGANGLLLSLASNQVDVGKLLGTAWLTPGTAGTPDVNAKLWNALPTVALPLIPATAGRTLVVDAAGLADANAVKVGPTGAGTAQTAGDIAALINTVDDFLDTEIAAIKAKTDSLPSDPADASDVAAAITAATSPLATAANLAVVAGYLDTEIAAIKVVTDAQGATGAGLSAVPWNAAWDAEVQSEVQDAIEVNNLDHLLKVAAVAGDAVDSSIVSRITSKSATPSFSSFANTTDSLEAIRDRGDAAWITGSGGAGTGARTVTITVNDGAAVLEGAKVRMISGAESYVVATNVSGVAVFALDDATWSVAITKAGYQFTPTTLVVDGTETQTYSMTAVTITPPTAPGLSAIEVLCLDSAGQPEAGVDVDIRIIIVPSGSQNIAFKGAKQTATSGVDGIARFEVVQSSTCEWKRGAAEVWQQVAIDADGVTNVTSVIGSP